VDRILEPELMTDESQALAYAQADFEDVNQGFVDRYRASFPKGVGGKMVDLGCGPADIPVRFARALPGYSITAVDGSEAMVLLAQQAVIAAGVADRVQVHRARLPMLPLPLQSFDAVVSNSLLHHIPDPFVFWNELVRLGKPGATVLIMDLFRPESPARAREIVAKYAAREAPVLKEDFYHSLCAAFTLREVRSQIRSRGLGGFVCELASDRHWVVWGHLPRGVEKTPPPSP
jgi:ubiquinone/menaquinone biosynthesis C-methylase UbiE